MQCNICPRKCNIDRNINRGFCNSGSQIKISRAAPHFWEEPCISGTNGSGTVFFTGCSLKCVFCQNYEISHFDKGKTVTQEELLKIFDNLIKTGVHNINLVTPSHYSLEICNALKIFNSPVPVVWNSSGYENVETLKMLEGLVDIYLPDIKYYDGIISLKYSRAENYFEYCSSAVKEMFRQVGNLKLNKNGIAEKGLLIRHLVLPGNISQSFKVLDFISENFPEETAISIMCQYVPYGEAVDIPPLNRRTTAREYKMVKQRALELGFQNLYFQSRESAEKTYIPHFNDESIDL
ncbi:MAG: 4Fe-4S cluster-binding domain-containing protein [Clostridia bacterium]|nr:4Fe-4S cluster-binding domain-containing protein [Clostridia bacterium]